MLIVQACTPGGVHEEMAELTREACERLGYRYVRYPLAHSADLKGAEPPCTFKPSVIWRAMIQHADEGDPVAWIDADAVLVRPLDELTAMPFDVAVTLREPHMLGPKPGINSPATEYLNAGVVFFRCSCAAFRIVDRWVRLAKERGNDQWALSDLVGACDWGGPWGLEQWRQAYDTVVPRLGARVKILAGCADGWNTWYFQPVAENAKILHFKGALRTRYDWRKICAEVTGCQQ